MWKSWNVASFHIGVKFENVEIVLERKSKYSDQKFYFKFDFIFY